MNLCLGWAFLCATLLVKMRCAAHSVYRHAFLAPLPTPIAKHDTFSPLSSFKFGKSRCAPLSPSFEACRHIAALGVGDGASNEPPEVFAGSEDIIDKGDLFSDRALELTMEDMAAREVDFENYKSRSVSHLRKVGLLVASVVTVGVLYTVMSALKGVMNQQHEKLSADRYDGRGTPSDGNFRNTGD